MWGVEAGPSLCGETGGVWKFSPWAPTKKKKNVFKMYKGYDFPEKILTNAYNTHMYVA